MSSSRRRRTACGTCIRRKVKCDETHPTCNRCKKGRFVCEGYEPKIVFVEENPAGGEAGSSAQDALQIPGAGTSSPQEVGDIRKSPSPSAPLDLEAWQANVAVAFTVENLFTHHQHSASRGPGAPRSWLELAINQAKPEIKMDSAIGALCMMYFGKRHHQLNLVLQSKVRYGRALSALRGTLRDPGTANSTATLRDTMALAIYEVVAFTGPENWMRHADGLAKLFQLRGPDGFQDPLSLAIFQTSRMLVILQHTLACKPCFLAEPAWQRVASTAAPAGTAYSGLALEIQDILCFLPGLLADLEAFKISKAAEVDRITAYNSLLDKVNATLSSVFQWRYRWQVENPWAAYGVPVSQESTSPLTPFETAIEFDSLANASAIDLYGAAFITLYKLGETLVGQGNFDLSHALKDANAKFSRDMHMQAGSAVLSMPDSSLDPETVAMELCAMVNFHFQESHRGTGVCLIIWPLKTAERILAHKPGFPAWISSIMDKIAYEDALEFVRAEMWPVAS